MAPIATDFRDWNVQWVTAKTPETAYGTAVAVLDKSGLFKGPDLAVRTPEIVTDDEQIGKGHDFPESQVIHSWGTELNRQWDASLFWTAWAFSFAMGAAAITGAVDPFTHTLTWLDEDATKQPPSATIEELIGDGTILEQKVYTGLCVNEVTISATGKNRLQLAMSMIGDGRIDVGVTAIPAGVPEEFLRGSNVKLTLNAVDLSSYVKAWSIKISNNLMADDGYVLGAAADLGLYRERLFFGKRTVEVALTLLIPPLALAGIEALLTAQTNAPIIIEAFGDVITHFAKFTIANFKLTGRPKAVDNNQLIYNITGTAMYAVADLGPLKVELDFEEATEFLL